MVEKQTKKVLNLVILGVFVASLFVSFAAVAPSPTKAETSTLQEDFELYQKYELFQKYEKKQKYSKYKKYAKNKKKYGFKDSKTKAEAKAAYDKYRLYKKTPAKYPQYEQYYELYKKYAKYKKYVTPYKKYSKYSKYKKYDKSEYNEGESYGGVEYEAGYDRYVAAQTALAATVGEADLGGGALGPDISVGLIGYTKSDLTSSYFRIRATKDYNVKNSAGTVLAVIPAATYTRVKYVSGSTLQIYESVTPAVNTDNIVSFDAADGDNSDIIFDINNPGSSYDQYRGKMKLSFYDSPVADGDRIWAINTLPMEQYVWGMGEIAGTGDMDHNRVMTTVFRTYGYWKTKFSTKYAAEGFKVTATTSSQLYYGYDWETAHPNIRAAAEDTAGKIVMYLNGATNEVTLTPYSSWTDGRTRSFEERWGSTDYPWCQSVADPYGKDASRTTAQLEAAGNHMVGLSAHGSLNLATDYSWDWDDILTYYFTAINIHTAYP